MRTAARVDENQKEIIKAFRKLGCAVLPLHQIGKGCPDLLITKGGAKAVLVEIKNGAKPASARALTTDQVKFHASWLGSIFVVKDLGDVLALVKGLER